MKRLFVLILIIAGYGAGYYTQSILESNQWKSIALSSHSVLSANTSDNNPQAQLVTNVSFDGTHFSPSSVSIKKTYMIAITNTSKTEGMWLQ